MKTWCSQELVRYSLPSALAGRLSESIHTASEAIKRSDLSEKERQRLYYSRGLAYYLSQRYEEAILDLRQVAFAKKKDSLLSPRAHLLLIATYYARAQRADQNVHYLTRLFVKRYPKSELKAGLLNWYKTI